MVYFYVYRNISVYVYYLMDIMYYALPYNRVPCSEWILVLIKTTNIWRYSEIVALIEYILLTGLNFNPSMEK